MPHPGTLALGLAWLGLAWLGLAWLGLAWLGLAWLGAARRGAVSASVCTSVERPKLALDHRRSPISLAYCAKPDDAVCVDSEGNRQSLYVPRCANRAFAEQNCKTWRWMIDKKATNPIGAVAKIDRKDFDLRILQSHCQIRQSRQFASARRAPNGPEINQHRVATIVGNTMNHAGKIRKREIRRRNVAGKHGERQRLGGNKIR